jgi:hypothetical protein
MENDLVYWKFDININNQNGIYYIVCKANVHISTVIYINNYHTNFPVLKIYE